MTLLLLLIVMSGSIIALYYGLGSLRAHNVTPMPATGPTSATGNISAVTEIADWSTYHKNLLRTGYEPDFPTVKSPGLNWKSTELDGDVYAEPLVVDGGILIATENNSLYYLNAGSGRLIWRTNLGAPVPGSSLPCGDIDPSGITGTPAVDLTTGTVYAVAFLNPTHHELFAVDLATGRVKNNLPVDPPGADPKVQQQRAGLALAGQYIYVAYGGLAGDCGNYHGWVVAYRIHDGATSRENRIPLSYQVPTTWAGGIWAPPGPAVDSSGNVYVATGNSGSITTFDFGNAVIKLSPDLKQLDWFAPSNWVELNGEDGDLGSTSPAILNSDYVFQIGKDGIGYLLREKNMGGVGGEVFSAQICGTEPFAGAYGAIAYSPPYILVPCTDGLVAINVILGPQPTFNVVWRGPNFVSGPPVVAGSSVWDVDVNNDLIYALDLRNGTVLFTDRVGAVTRFTSLGVGQGQVFVSANRRLLSYSPQESTSPSILSSLLEAAKVQPQPGPQMETDPQLLHRIRLVIDRLV